MKKAVRSASGIKEKCLLAGSGTALFFLFLFLLPSVLGSEESNLSKDWVDPASYLKISIGVVALVIIMIFTMKDFVEKHKRPIFWILTAVITLQTLYMAVHTVHLNLTSATKGPVHWHADYEIWHCSEKIDLINPKGFRNKIGTPVLHEHNDDRIHVEGVVKSLGDVSLGTYFEVIGGHLDAKSLTYPTEDAGVVSIEDGDSCPEGPGMLKVFVNGKRISEPEAYVLHPDANVPPGDCIIVDFSPGDVQATDKLCTSWKVKNWTYDNFETLRG